MSKFKYWLFVTTGTILVVFGLVGAFLFAVTNDNLRVTITGVSICIVAVVLGIWLVRRAEKSWEQLFDYVTNIFFWS